MHGVGGGVEATLHVLASGTKDLCSSLSCPGTLRAVGLIIIFIIFKKII
jgi:hypothetical protein